jgi:hypothetical protein
MHPVRPDQQKLNSNPYGVKPKVDLYIAGFIGGQTPERMEQSGDQQDGNGKRAHE